MRHIAKNDHGQILIVTAYILPVLLLLGGLAVDVGLICIAKAKLSSAVDSACLAGMKGLAVSQATATTYATDMFNANWCGGSCGANPPVPTVTFPTDQWNDQQVHVAATVPVSTVFMRVIPAFATVNVSDTAQSLRGKLTMTVVLDRSGSMNNDGGGAALQSAVPTFVNDFNNTTDEVALVSFASYASVDFAIGFNFKTPITNAVAAMNFSGGTFGTGAGTNPNPSAVNGPPMSMADQQNTSVASGNPNQIKVVVYFTDGLMNVVQDNFTCVINNNPTQVLINYGGYDSGNTVDFLDPTGQTGNANGSPGDWGSYSGGVIRDAGGDICQNPKGTNVTKFPQQAGGQFAGGNTFTRANVTAEAQNRAITTATAIRGESPIPTYIFTIGLGDNGAGGMTQATQNFLAQLANVQTFSDGSANPHYNNTQPSGLFIYISSCPSATCTAEVTTAFQTIAAKILLRLTQ